MSKKKQTASDVARELYEHRHDQDEWEDEAEEIEVTPSRTAVLSIRLNRDELDALEQAAAQKGENLSEYVRRAITYRMRGSGFMFTTVLNRTIGYPATRNQTEQRSVWNEPERDQEISDPRQIYASPGVPK